MTEASRPRPADWIWGLASGALLGAVILGGFGRLMMRALTIAYESERQLTLDGTLNVVMRGVFWGVVFAVVRLGLPSIPRIQRSFVDALYALVLVGIFLWIIQPVDRDRLIYFGPVLVAFAAGQQLLARYGRRHRAA